MFTFFIMYLAGSFSNSSLIISDWGDGSRVIVSVFGTIVSFVCFLMVYFNYEEL